MKFKHDFKLIKQDGSTFHYKESDNNVRLDFFKGMMRVAMYKDDAELLPTYSVCPGDLKMPFEGRERLSTEGFEEETVVYSSTDGTEFFETASAKVSVERFNFRMKVCDKNENVLFQDRDYLAYNFDGELGNGAMHYCSRSSGEEIFGLGDKTGNVNKAGRRFVLATSDSMGFDARYSDPLYKQVPFYICRNKDLSYGIYYDTYANGAVDFGVEHNNYYLPFKSFKSEDDVLVYYVFFGSVEEIVKAFSWICGRQMDIPYWSLKYCGSTMNYTDAPDADAQLRNFISLCNKYGFSAGGFYLSSGYTQIGDKRYVFNWNTDKIPSPENLAEYFKQNGVEFIPNVKPAFLTDHFMYDMIAKKGWFLHYKDGTPAVFPFWSGYGSYLDFTNKEAFNFWKDCIRTKLVEKGYRSIWNDNNEYDVLDDDVYAAGFGKEVKAKRIRPLFSYLMTMASREAQEENAPGEKAFSVSRSGIAGMQRISMTWTGDNNTSFADFRYNHKMAMTMSLSGLYNFGQDIGGFAGPKPSRELFLRWIQYGVFTPRFVLHSWNPDGSSNMPWLYEDAIPLVKKQFDLREKLLPYLYNEFDRSRRNYEPVIYPVFLKHPDYDVESDTYFFGDNILVCPVFDEGQNTVTVDLPENDGGWYFNSRAYEGSVTLPCTLEDTCVHFVKAGSVVPYNNGGNVCFTVYAGKSGNFNSSCILDLGNNKKEEVQLAVNCSETEINIRTNKKDAVINLVDQMNRTLKILN